MVQLDFLLRIPRCRVPGSRIDAEIPNRKVPRVKYCHVGRSSHDLGVL
jgi:hypothetical protein